MKKPYTFDAEILDAGRGGGYIEFPHDTRKEFGTGGRVPVKASFDGHPYRGSLVPMGGPRHILPILKEIRVALGKGSGDRVRVVIEPDTEARTVEVPPELAAALEKHPSAKKAFDELSYTHRKEHARAVAEAKAAETKERRIQRVLEALVKK